MIKGKKVAVAMSGGVDSSLCAALLREQGYAVFGITMLLADDSRDVNGMSNEVKDARQMANFLGIEHIVIDFRTHFSKKVISYFLEEYLAARTPNPCVMCNRFLKFGILFSMIREMGADFLATGHYVRIEKQKDCSFALKKGRDKYKDQSYVLYRLPLEILPHILFPLGKYQKIETRALAQKFSLPIADKADSQEICFIPNDDYKDYLSKKRPQGFQAGDIVDECGKVLGQHRGLPFYTIGQRKGLGIAAAKPLYVTSLDKENNRVIVGWSEGVYASTLLAKDVHWLIAPPKEEIAVSAKIRYGSNESKARVVPLKQDVIKVFFSKPQRAITPGQSVVFYAGDRLLGGATIEAKG